MKKVMRTNKKSLQTMEITTVEKLPSELTLENKKIELEKKTNIENQSDNMEKEEKFSFCQNWENDGTISWKNAKTLARYKELKNEIVNTPLKEFSMFVAFSREQFAQGLEDIGESEDNIYHYYAGIYGTKEGIKNYIRFQEKVDERKAEECDPQEVYCYEYNNYECCLGFEGDKEAIEVVVSLFGKERAKEIKRFNAFVDIDEL